MRRLFALLILSVLIAGCTDDAADPAQDGGAPKQDGEDKPPTVPYEVDPATANETELEGAHLHDEWGEATMLQLADLRVDTQSCSGDNPLLDLFLMGAGLFRDQEVHKGCVLFAFDDGKIVPEGTARLFVDIDATDALVQGGMRLSYGNEAKRLVALEETTEPESSWTIEMEPVEWDLPHSTETEWFFLLQPSGQVAILDGTVAVTITAERMADWRPILGSEHIDHWDLEDQKDAHDFVTPDAIRALDNNTTVLFPSFADRLTRVEAQAPLPLEDIIPPETTQVSLAVKWSPVEGCPAGHECWLGAWLSASNGGRGGGFSAEPVATGTDWAIYTYDVPEPLAPDSTYANESVYNVRAFVRACPNGQEVDTPLPFLNGCMGEALATMRTDARVEVVAWRTAVDIEATKARLGLE